MADDTSHLPRLFPGAGETPLEVPHYPTQRWHGLIRPYVIVDADEWAWFELIQPTKPLIFVDGNNNPSRTFPAGRPYLRFTEVMPDGRDARHTLARYLHTLSAYRVQFSGGPSADRRGPPVRLKDRDCTNLLPSNRELAIGPGVNGREPRRGFDASWSVKIRLEAVIQGRDPEEAWKDEAKRIAEKNDPEGGAR